MNDGRAPGRREVGYKKNGFGRVMGNMEIRREVAPTLRDVVAEALTARGHRVVADRRDVAIRVEGIVSECWIEVLPKILYSTAVATVEVRLQVLDRSGTRVAERRIRYEAEASGQAFSPATEALEQAIAGFAQEVTDDERLARAIRRAGELSAEPGT